MLATLKLRFLRTPLLPWRSYSITSNCSTDKYWISASARVRAMARFGDRIMAWIRAMARARAMVRAMQSYNV